ncbi:MAG: hypothetical protein ACYC3X_31590 [Pirellulaceae bacterium]
MSDMSDVTRILNKIEADDPLAAEQLLPLIYDKVVVWPSLLPSAVHK